MTQTILDFFNPNKIGHLMAYDELMKTGRWPHGFSDGLDFPPNWAILLEHKIASAYTQYGMSVGGMKQKLHQAKIRLMNLADHRPEVETAVAVMGEVENTLIT